VDSLTREAELLKANFEREAYRDVLDSDKLSDAAMMQMLLTAQFEMLASLDDTLAMDEEQAVTHAKGIINKLLQTGFTAASQVVKPDGSLPVVEIFPPSKKGTPKRKSTASVYAKPIAAPVFSNPQVAQVEQVHASPLKASPRRRKVLGTAKKGVSFTPVKKPKARGVRWRDDENDDATLADFSQTPQKLKSSPTEQPSSQKPLEPPVPTYVEEPSVTITEPLATVEESSPSFEAPEISALPASKAGRFSAGFLSKSARLSTVPDGSPVAPSLSLRYGSSSPEVARTPPLRSLDVGKSGNLSPPSRVPTLKVSPPRSLDVIMDENNPPATGSGSDSETSSIDPRKLRSAVFSAKEKARRASLMTGTAASNARRVSSIGSLHERTGPRPSMPGPLSSSTNGISRHYRPSDRRRSPPMSGSPSDWKTDRSLTQGQARRMNMGGSMRMENFGGSPKERPGLSADKARRVTISVGSAAGHRRQESKGNTSATLR
jgi:kinesin family protein 18/19